MGGAFRLGSIALVMLPVTLLLAPVQLLAIRFAPHLSRHIPMWWHRLAVRVIGVRVHVSGKVPTDRPLMIVANHVSWSDILVLGSVMPLCFVAKAEVRTWPGVNWLARLQRTVFVDRDRRRDSVNQADTLAARLAAGDVMVLFAEGTTGDGNRVAPFKTALFAAIGLALRESGLANAAVQPVALAYTRLHGMPLGRFHQARAAWPGDLELVPHLSAFLRDGAYDVEVVFAPPVEYAPGDDRKRVAARTFAAVRTSFGAAMRMRAVNGADGQLP